jgi:hypothetical protein
VEQYLLELIAFIEASSADADSAIAVSDELEMCLANCELQEIYN